MRGRNERLISLSKVINEGSDEGVSRESDGGVVKIQRREIFHEIFHTNFSADSMDSLDAVDAAVSPTVPRT